MIDGGTLDRYQDLVACESIRHGYRVMSFQGHRRGWPGCCSVCTGMACSVPLRRHLSDAMDIRERRHFAGVDWYPPEGLAYSSVHAIERLAYETGVIRVHKLPELSGAFDISLQIRTNTRSDARRITRKTVAATISYE
jgi:hypothetical protein